MDPRIAGRRRAVAEGRARENLRRLVVVLVVGGLVVAVLSVLRSPFLSIEDIVIQGASTVDITGVLEASGVTGGRPLIEVDPDAIESSLLGDPWVAEATVVRDWPRRLIVDIVERTAVAWVEVTDGWVLVADDGTPLEPGTPPDGAARVVGSGTPASALGGNGRVLAAALFLAALPADHLAGAVVDVGGGELAAHVAGYRVRLGLPEEMAEKAGALAAVLATAPEPGSEITIVAPSRPAVMPPGEAN